MKVPMDEEVNGYQSHLKDPLDFIFPSGIDVMQPQYINIDGVCIACLLCLEFPYNVYNGYLDSLINYGEGVEICIRQEPQNKGAIIKEITHYLGFTKYKMSQGDNQVDSGLQENAKNHSEYMKRQLTAGDEFFYINMIIKVTADTAELLEDKMRKVEGELAGKNIFYKRADFRQLEAFLSTLPIEKMDKRIKEQTSKNILSSGLCGLYPFTSSSLSDPEGMFMGINDHDNSPVILDIFNTDHYANANMVLLGNSGSGKTFTTQMIANRFRMQKIPVMMVCPLKGHEYKPLCESVGGNFFRFAPGTSYKLNVMDIQPTKSIGKSDSFLASKLQRLQIVLSLMFPDISQRELHLFDAPLQRIYAQKGITMDNASLYEATQNGKISLNPKIKEMPLIEDLYEEIQKIPELQHRADEMKPFITGSLSFLNAQTNIDLKNSYTVADISGIPENLVTLAMFIILEVFLNRIQRDVTQKVALVLDEVWKLIGSSGNTKVANYVLELFKTIRGYGGAAIAATQDIDDFLALEDGKYGKGIINNAKIKIILQLEEMEAEAIGGVLKLSEAELAKVTKFRRGEGLLYAASNHLVVKFIPFETEKRLITTDRKELIQYGRTEER